MHMQFCWFCCALAYYFTPNLEKLRGHIAFVYLFNCYLPFITLNFVYKISQKVFQQELWYFVDIGAHLLLEEKGINFLLLELCPFKLTFYRNKHTVKDKVVCKHISNLLLAGRFVLT